MRFLRPSSGALTVYTASGICRGVSASYSYRELELFQLTHDNGKKQKKLDKYPTLCIQFWAPDDGRRNRVKHVEHLW